MSLGELRGVGRTWHAMSLRVGLVKGALEREIGDAGEQVAFQRLADFDAQFVGYRVRGAIIKRVFVDENDDVGDARLVGEVGRRHVGAATVMKSAIARPQRNGDARLPDKFGRDAEQAVRVAQILRRQFGEALAFGNESHATALNWHITERNPARNRVHRILMRPIRLVLMELSRRRVVRLFGQNLVVPKAQIDTRQLLSHRRDIGMQGERFHRLVAGPNVDNLLEHRVAVGIIHSRCVQRGEAKSLGFFGRNDAGNMDKTIFAIEINLLVGKGVGSGGRRK